MIARNHKLLFLFIATAIMLACVPTFAPASAPVPTYDPNSISTVIAQTAAAASTQTAIMLPPTLTSTATPTATATASPTETPTFIFILPTLTAQPTLVTPGSSGFDFDCQIISQIPPNNMTISRSSVFEARWKVVNIGKKTWDADTADYRYTSGEKMHRTGAFDFPESVVPGGTFEFVIPMQAPIETGTYTTTWKITSGKDRFCSMSITIIVN